MPSARSLVGTPILLAAAASFLGCGGGGGPLSVQGSVQITTASSTTGFQFTNTTSLYDDRVPPAGGSALAGHCTFGDTQPQVVSLAVSSPSDADAGVLGLRSFDVQLTVGAATTTGTVSADVAGGTFTGSGGPGQACNVTPLYLSSKDGVAGVQVDCTLTDASSQTVHAVAELHFSGCS